MEDINPGRIVTVLLFIVVSATSIDCAILSNEEIHNADKFVGKFALNRAQELLLRHRRRAASPTAVPGKLLANEVVLNGTEDHTQAFVHWSGKLKSEAVFILTLKVNASGVADSQAWRSLDYGTSYRELPISDDALISFFFVSPVDHTKMVFTDVKNRRLYTSTDEMQSHKNYSLPASSDDIRMHNGNSSWMLLYDYYQRKLYVTQDFGANWKLLQSEVNSRFYWGVKGYDPSNVVHMEIQPQDSEQAYYMRCTIPDCKGNGDGIDYNLGPFMSQTMLLSYGYIFVQKSNLDGSDSHMMVSYRRGSFSHTYFPDNVQTKDFLILDASEEQVFIAVNHGDRGGVSLYLSDPTGRYYVLSLSRVHHRAASYWFDVDMHRVRGLNGTYLANQQLNTSSSRQQQLKSLISFDKGGTWLPVPSPINSCASDDCALLLRLDMANLMQDWILSEERAPGFLIAHGHFGRSYEHDVKNMSVFTSVDGGWTWNTSESSMKGVYHFNILDQGSIVTAIKTGDQEPTNKVFYTYDEGQNWHSEEFGNKKLIVDGVLNEPGINTVVVSVYGHENTSAAWTMVKLNFSQILSEKCEASDYTSWMVSDHDSSVDENCLLGQKVIYKRRKRGSKCYNGELFVRNISSTFCTCDKEDFECDFGYARHGMECKKESWFDDGYIALNCTEGSTFNKSQGYRKVGSDKCVGGVESQPKYHPDSSATCPLVAPDHMLLVANVSVVATGKPVHFHFTQRRGSIHNTQYVWNFNDSMKMNVKGLAQAQQQTHNFSKAGIYYVSVTASNQKGQHTSNLLRLRVEDVVHTVAVFKPWAAMTGFLVNVSVATNLRAASSADSSLHFLYRFGDEEDGNKDVLTWNSSITHTYSNPGTYTMTVTAVNSVSAIAKQVTVNVIDDGLVVQLGFSPNVRRLFDHGSVSSENVFFLLERLRQEFTLMLGINLDRLALSLNSTLPVLVDVLVLPPPPSSPASEISAKQIVQTFVDLVGNKSFTLVRSTSSLPRALGDVNITSVKILKSGSGGSGSGGGDKKTGPNLRPVYITIPIVLLAGAVTGLVLLYYRRRFHHIRRYSMVNQNEDTDALLDDDEDEPPLDLRSDARDSVRSRDENMLDLGTGSHLVMVTGSSGGDGAENC